MVADKVTKMDAKMVIKEHLQRVECAVGAGGCADDNVSSRLVGEVVDVVGMVADRQVVEEEVDMLEQQVTKVNTNMHQHVQGKRQGEESRVEAFVCDDNIVFEGCLGSD